MIASKAAMRRTEEDDVIARAMAILAKRARRADVLEKPQAARDYMRLALGTQERECFAVLFLDNTHKPLHFEVLFKGTLTQTSVYPRIVVSEALKHNAAAVIFSHNHPSGITEPSHADMHLTSTLKSALALIDVRVLDHIIVGAEGTVSFAERGLL